MTKIPKICHMYWGKDKPLSWLRWLTVKTFSILNPDWRVIVWYPNKPGNAPRWSTKEHSYYAWSGKDWFKHLAEAGPNVQVTEATLSNFPSLSEVHRSDLLRWRLLHEHGGFWSDFDIVYFRPMEAAGLDMTADVLLCWGETEELKGWQAIGFLAGKPGNTLFKDMYSLGLEICKVPNLGYQDLGTSLLLKFALPSQLKFCTSRIGQIPQRAVYPFISVSSQKKALWNDYRLLDIGPGTVGLHWFAAQKESCTYEASWHLEKDISKEHRPGGMKWAIGQAGIFKSISTLGVKYSIIMPYMDRSDLLWNTLTSFQRWYSGRHDWEVVIVRDSKCVKPHDLQDVVLHWQQQGQAIRVMELEASGCYGPSKGFNAGVGIAQGQYIILTSPEIYHDVNVLAGMDAAFSNCKEKYVVCACLDRAQKQGRLRPYDRLQTRIESWLQHSVHRPVCYHFCSALAKDDYLRLGGFDEDFSEGFCFDDDDFRENVIKAGLEIIQDDNLLVSHQGHRSTRVPNKMARWRHNKELYESKHGPYIFLPAPSVIQPSVTIAKDNPRVTVVCVLKSGGIFTPEYVVKLRNMVARNTTVPHNFICLTDLSLPDDIQVGLLQDNLPGWWSKLELFRPGAFKCPMVVYFDLDTLILGNVDQLLSLPSGNFYGLRPWNKHNYNMGYLGSGIMAWNPKDFGFIYEEFKKEGIDINAFGDQVFISMMLDRHGVEFLPLQNHIQGIKSYKRECRAGLPVKVRIVCFHGRPRVHECQDRWVKEAWN